MTDKTHGKRRFNRWVIVAAIVGVVGIGGIAALTLLPKRDANHYMAEAQAYVAKGNLSAALIQLRNAVQREPDNPNARYQLAAVALRAGDPVSAEKEIKVAQEKGLAEDSVLPVLAAAYLEQGKYDLVVNSIPEGNRAAKTESEIRTLRGMAQLGLRNTAAGEASFKSALALDPKMLRAEIGLARVDASRQEYKEADSRLDGVLAHKPAPEIAAEALLLKGQVHRLDKDADGAILAYSKVLEIAPSMLRARLERAEVYLEQNDNNKAAGDVGYVLKRAPTHPLAVHFQALLDLRKGDEDAAYDILQRQGTALGRFAPNLLLMAKLQVKRNELEGAQTKLTDYLQAVPRNVDARLMLGNLLLRKNLPDQAITVLKAAPLDMDEGDLRVFRLLASASMRAGRVSEAGEWLDKAASVSNTPKARTQLAVERLSLGQTDEAIKDLDSAIQMDPKATDSRVLLIVTHLRQGNFDEAEKIAKSLQTDMPDSPIPDNLLGGISLARGDREGARRNFESAVQKKSDFLPAQMNIAKLDIAEGKLDDAVRQYTSVLEQNDKNTDVMIALAELALRRQQPTEAESWLTKAVAVDSNAVRPRIALINFHLGQKDYGKAMTAARELRQVAPSNSDAMDAMGRVQLASGEASSAVDTYRGLVSAAPNVPLAHERLAQALVAAGDLAGAKTALRTGMASNPDAPQLASDLANLLQRTGDTVEALTVVRDWQRRHPDLAAGDLIVANVLAQQKQFGEAATSLASAQKKEPSGSTVVALARMHAAAGNGDAATQELRQWIQQRPKDVAARDALAAMLISQKHYDDAAHESEELLKLQPNNPVVLNNLAWLYHQRKDSRALDYAERAHSLAPRSPAIMDTLGYILVTSGDTKRGVPLLKDAYDSSQKMPEIGYHLAAGLAKSGQSAEARTVLEAVLADKRTFDDKAEAKKLLDSLAR